MVVQKYRNLADIFFELAVNFLLYVVLIIVFYMLVRFYLEEDIENKPLTPSLSGKGFVYVPVATEEDNIELTNAPINEGETESSKIEEPDSSDPLIHENNVNISAKSTSSFLSMNAVDTDGTKEQVLWRVIYCALGLNISFCIWGLLQERMLTQTYDGDYFIYSYGLVFMNRLGGLLLSYILMRVYDIQWAPSALWEYSFPAVANMLSAWCQYEALRYVSFPMAMLAKAFKMVPVMLMGKFMNNKTYASSEYLSGFTIGVGLFLFLNSSEQIDFKQNSFGDLQGVTGALCGVALLLLFLFFDSFTGQWQTRMFQRDSQLSPLQMMLIMNAFSAVFSFVTLVHEEQLYDALAFVYSHPELALHVIFFCVSATVGQLFIFYTVKNFGAVVFAAMMSVRILFSTLLSCVVYSHPVNELGLVGIVLVFGAIAFRIRGQIKGKPLLAFILTERDKQRSLILDQSHSSFQDHRVLKEWHEHLDI